MSTGYHHVPTGLKMSSTGYHPQYTCPPQDSTRTDTQNGYKMSSTGYTHQKSDSPTGPRFKPVENTFYPVEDMSFILWTTPKIYTVGDILWGTSKLYPVGDIEFISCGGHRIYILWVTGIAPTGYDLNRPQDKYCCPQSMIHSI